MTEIIVRMENNGQLTPVRQLIRCKDCKKHGSEDCILWTDAVECETVDDWFCADGKAKAGEQE